MSLDVARRHPAEFELELEREENLRKARGGFLYFVKHTYPAYIVNWHHRKLAQALDKFERGEIKRLIVTYPPRMGKSEQVSRRLPAYILGRNPRRKIIAASYSAELAESMNRDVQRIIDSEAYREVFPDTLLQGGASTSAGGSGSWVRNMGLFETVGYGGTYRSVGVGGGITGQGGDRIIIDDYCKNQEEADSQVFREKLWGWYTSTLRTRCEPDAGICITATRWHEDDLIGRLLKLQAEDPNADQWVVINFPAIAEGQPTKLDPRRPGEPLWPSRFSLADLLATKVTLGSKKWSSLYQQRPSPEKGLIVDRAWWKYYGVQPDRFDQIIQSWDLTFKKSDTADFVVGVVLGRKGADIYLLDMVRARMSFTQTLHALRTLSQRWPQADIKLIERAANGEAVCDTLKSEIPGIVLVSAIGSKVARANAASPRIESGNTFIPTADLAPGWGGPEGDVVEEWTAFPSGTHDDICFVAGTPIATARGSIPIENIRIGDQILTPFGLDTITQVSESVAPIIENLGLTGTPNHPVFSWGEKGFTRLDAMSYDAISRLTAVELARWTYRKSLCLMESPTGSWGRELITLASQRPMLGGSALRDFMWRFGSFIRGGQLRKARSFTTATAIFLITILAILNAYRIKNIARSIRTRLTGLQNRESIWSVSDQKQKLGTPRPGGVNGIGSMVSKWLGDARTSLLPWPVKSAKSRSPLNDNGRFTAAGAATLKLGMPATVYNLETERFGVYYANGILVHNCDAMSQGILRFMAEGVTDFIPISLKQVNRFTSMSNNGL